MRRITLLAAAALLALTPAAATAQEGGFPRPGAVLHLELRGSGARSVTGTLLEADADSLVLRLAGAPERPTVVRMEDVDGMEVFAAPDLRTALRVLDLRAGKAARMATQQGRTP